MNELPPSSGQEPLDQSPEAYRSLYEQALQREQAEREAKEYWHTVATHDPLTGVLNRLGLEEVLARNPTPQAVLVIDGDKIKSINDNLGHPRGDDAIKELAALLSSSVRSTDTVARTGGDEFVVILDTHSSEDMPDQGNRHERIAEIDGLILINKRRFTAATAELLNRNENADLRALGFSFSLGSAIWQEGMSVTDLIEQADQDMYRNKRKKRRD